MKKPRYTYYTLRGFDGFQSFFDGKETRYLMRQNSSGLWTSVYLSAGVQGSIKNLKDTYFDKCVHLGNWVKAAPKLARRAAQLNKR